MMDNGGGGFNELYFNLQKQQQQQMKHHQQLQNLQQKNQNSCFTNVLLPKSNSNSNNNQIMGFSQNIEAHVEKQRQEVDWFISLHNERLRLALQEHRKQQTALLLRKYESKTQFLLGQKDEEISKALNRTMELENLMKTMEIEIQTWQRLAKENEVMVISLNNTIEQLRESAYLPATNEVEDAESCCETGENRGHIENEEHKRGERMLICKGCNSSNSCVVFLPCRHLCSCKGCEAFLGSCPVCGMVKKSSIEVLM